MKKVMLVGCEMFLCLSEIFAMHLDKAMEFSKWSASIEQAIKYKLPSVDSDSEATLNEDVSVSDSSVVLHCGLNERRRRSKSEEFLSPIPCFDGQQSRGFNEGRSRTRSETTNCEESDLNISDMLESKKQREERSRLIESENADCVLKISACQVSRFLGEDFFREFKASRTYADKIKILTRGTVDYIHSCAQQKKEAIEENKALAEQNELLARENERQGERIKKLENKLLVAEAQTKVVSPAVSAKDESSANMETKKSDFHNQEINFGVPSLRIKKFEYVGEMTENMAHGKGMVSHVYKIVSIAGTFHHNCLDLSKKVNLKGPCGEEYAFEGTGIFDSQAMISMDDISKIDEAYRFGSLSTVCLGFSNDDGKRKWIVFSPNFVYQGEVSDRNISGEGIMIKSTGEILKGKFKNGHFLGDLL